MSPSTNEHRLLDLRYRSVALKSGEIAYVDEGSGPALLLLHGAPFTSLGFFRMIRELRSKYRVLAPDLPGFGGSTAAPGFGGSLAEYAHSIHEFWTALKLGQLVVFGCDSSACLALAAACDAPSRIKGLVIADTVPVPLGGMTALVRLALKYVVASRLVRFLNRRFNLIPWLVASVAPFRRPFSKAERSLMLAQYATGAAEVRAPKAYLIRIVTRLCLNELDSPRRQKEEARSDRLPEPVSLDETGIELVESLDQISMAFLVVLQCLSPAERAVLLLHEVFDFDHNEVAELVNKTPSACRQLLKRAKACVASERRALETSGEVHRALLAAFVRAATSGDLAAIKKLLADDVRLVVDAGPQGASFGRVRNLPGPLVGAHKVAAFIAAVAPQSAHGLATEECTLNGQPAILVLQDGEPHTAILLSVVGGQVRSVFMHADRSRLGHVRKAHL